VNQRFLLTLPPIVDFAMKDILVLGAGRSATVLINHLDYLAHAEDWTVTVADASATLLEEKVSALKRSEGVHLNVSDKDKLNAMIAGHKLVISLLPPDLHPIVASICVAHGKHLITASYVSDAMRLWDAPAKAKGVMLLNECGLDPGIDHISALELINKIKEEGGHIMGFQSYCGGLVAPESDDNPFGYKISWNPRNVINAGKGVSRYLSGGREMMVPYHRLFRRLKAFHIQGIGTFEGYPNRDSLPYIDLYGLSGCNTFIRGTLRKQGYCQAWHYIIQAGLTDDNVIFRFAPGSTYAQLLAQLIEGDEKQMRSCFAQELGVDDNNILDALEWLGLFGATPLPFEQGTMADFLEDLMIKKLALAKHDKDMIIMIHEVDYVKDGKHFITQAKLVRTGKNDQLTAMAETVGIPLAKAAFLTLKGKIGGKGVVLPLEKEIYGPLMRELDNFGLRFETTTIQTN
jgi:saccharopine dehydrogenase (NADP+, L-glutamate forming)